MTRAVALVGFALVFGPGLAHAGEFWVDPVHGKPGNDGSSTAPWRGTIALPRLSVNALYPCEIEADADPLVSARDACSLP